MAPLWVHQYDIEFDWNHPYIPTTEEIKGMLDKGGDATDNAQINDVVIGRVRCKDDESALLTLKWFLEQRHVDVTPFIQSIRTLTKEIGSWHAQ